MLFTHASRESVFEAATLLHGGGQKPTTTLIRQTLGGGSQTTIHKYLTEWKAIQQNKDNIHIKRATVKIHEHEATNVELNERVNGAMNEIHGQQLLIEQLRVQNLNLQASNNAYLIAFENFQTEFTRKVAELENTFTNAISLLSTQVNSVINNSFSNVQEIGFAFQEKVLTERLKVKELQNSMIKLEKSNK
jgi:hypothetical protein